MRIHWSNLALDHVGDIVEYLAAESPASADRWLEGIFTTVERLEQFPKSGRVVPEVRREDVRQILYKRYRVICRVRPDRVEILTVRHMRQHLDPDDLIR